MNNNSDPLSKFLVWRPGTMTDGICKLKSLSGVTDSHEIDEGISRLSGWPSQASAKMDSRFPKDKGLADSLYGAGCIVISEKVKLSLENKGIRNLEYLPILILDHSDQVVTENYFILNSLECVDCIDVEASGADINDLDEDSFCGCERLILKENSIPHASDIFRLDRWKQVIIIRRDLADILKKENISGLMFIEPLEYTGLV